MIRAHQIASVVIQGEPVPAAAKGRAVVVNGNHMFNRPGPRLVDALEWLVGFLHDRPDWAPPDFPWEPL